MSARYCSFDMGVKHLACCVVEVRDAGGAPTIVHWELINTLDECRSRALTSARNIKIEVAVEALVDALRAREQLWESVAEVVVEQQPVARMPVSNTLCKCLSHVLQAFFFQRGARVRFCSPKRKLTVASVDDAAAPAREKAKDRYARHKRAAIDETRRRIAADDDRWRAYFEGVAKKDDLADAYLQALVVVEDDAAARAKAAERARKQAERDAKRAAQEREKAERKRVREAKQAEAARKKAERARKKAEREATIAERKREREREREEPAGSPAPKRRAESADCDKI